MPLDSPFRHTSRLKFVDFRLRGAAWRHIFGNVRFCQNESALELLNIIFENTTLTGSFWQHNWNFEFSLQCAHRAWSGGRFWISWEGRRNQCRNAVPCCGRIDATITLCLTELNNLPIFRQEIRDVPPVHFPLMIRREKYLFACVNAHAGGHLVRYCANQWYFQISRHPTFEWDNPGKEIYN